MRTRTALSALSLLSLASMASASTLWDQSAINFNSPISMANWTTTGFGQTEAFGMTDISVPAGGWTVQSITVYMGTYAFSTPSQAVFNLFPKTGSLPTAANNPRRIANGGSGVNVAATSTYLSGDVLAVTSTMSVNIPAGDWWISLTPKFGSNGDVANQWPAASLYGNSQAVRFAAPLDATWSDNAALLGEGATDGAILIEGIATPAPSSLALLGLGGLIAGRRRR